MVAGPLNIARKSIGGRSNIGGRRIAKPGGPITYQEPFSFPARRPPYSFTPPKSGYWKFILWGPGGPGSIGANAGGSGAYAEVSRFLTTAQAVTIVAGQPFAGTPAADTTVAFPDGSVVTAGHSPGQAGGVASGPFDFAINGSAGPNTGNLTGANGGGTGGGAGGSGTGSGSGGAGAPGRIPYLGGIGAGFSGGSTDSQASIGGGSLESQITSGPGHVLAVLISE